MKPTFVYRVVSVLVAFFAVALNQAWAAEPYSHPFAYELGATKCSAGQVFESRCVKPVVVDGKPSCASDGFAEACYPAAQALSIAQPQPARVANARSAAPVDGFSMALAAVSQEGAAGVKKCSFTQQTCSDATPVKNIQGYDVAVWEVGGCWQYTSSYQCSTQDFVDDCGEYRDNTQCEQIGSRCISRDDDGGCNQYEQTYRCIDKPGEKRETTVCTDTSYCADGVGCFETGYKPDTDFGKAVAIVETGRQAGIYLDLDNFGMFKGESEECSIKVLGGATIANCCKASAGGQDFKNNEIVKQAASIGAQAAKQGMKAGSKYVYDQLYQVTNPEIFNKGLTALKDWTQGWNAPNPVLNFYGFTFSFSMANGIQFVSFDPYSFAFQIALKVVMEWMQCESSEQVMALKMGQNLCVHVDTYCYKKVMGVCIERKQKHCCFNSKLAKIINRQGREQLGLPLDVCDGLTAAQLQALDFSRIDMAEFIADVAPAEMDMDELMNRVGKTVQDYYTR